MIQQNKQTMRYGISIIEVLTAIVVAMIGVFGVMVMIPFAVSQAEQGLDQEKATSLALNAFSEFEIRNFVDTNRWAVTDAGGTPFSLAGQSARVYVIDPIGVAERGTASTPRDSGFFPFVHPTVETAISATGTHSFIPLSGAPIVNNANADQSILIERVTITDGSTTVPMSRPLANHLFAWSSGLVFNEPSEADIAGSASYPEVDVAPPRQVLDQLSDGTFGNRQSLKDMDYVVVAVPSDISAESIYSPTGVADRVVSWRTYFVVYKDRDSPVELGIGAPDVEAYDRIFEVTPPVDQAITNGAALDPFASPLDPQTASYRLSVGGGDLEMTEVVPGLPTEYSSKRREIRRGDWMMLTNVTFAPTTSPTQAFRNRYFQQVNFYQVVDADFDLASGIWSVSLEGPDFDFLHPIDSSLFPTIDYLPPPAGNPGCEVTVDASASPLAYEIQPSRTFAVHLPNVMAVFERTFR